VHASISLAVRAPNHTPRVGIPSSGPVLGDDQALITLDEEIPDHTALVDVVDRLKHRPAVEPSPLHDLCVRISIPVCDKAQESHPFDPGGGMIGAGAHASVAEANARFLDEVERSLSLLHPVEELPLPQAEMVRFNVMTYSGPKTAAGIPDELAQGGRPLSPQFLAGNDVITQLRMV
jgi:hypothetical protein